MKINILILIFLLTLLLPGCSREMETVKNSVNQKTDTIQKKAEQLKDTNRLKKSDEVFISLIESFVNIGEFEDDIADDINEYRGMYTTDLEMVVDTDIPVWEDLIIDNKNNEITAHIDYYENGKKINEFNLSDIIIDKNILTANLRRNGKEEIFKGRFIKYPFVTEETDFIYGLLTEREGNYILYEAEY